MVLHNHLLLLVLEASLLIGMLMLLLVVLLPGLHEVVGEGVLGSKGIERGSGRQKGST